MYKYPPGQDGVNYITKMATDFKKFCESSPQIQSIIDKLNIDPSPLCLPKSSNLYKNEVFQQGRAETLRNRQGDLDDFKAPTPNPYFMGHDSEEEFGKRKTFITQDVPSAQKTVDVPEPYMGDTAQSYAEKAKSVTQQMNFVLSSLSVENDHNKGQHKKDRIYEMLENIQQHMNLPSLLVSQQFTYRDKRYKKYSEPLSSVRHEDLLEQNKMTAKKDLEEQVKVHKVSMHYTRKVLSKAKKAQRSKSETSKFYQKHLLQSKESTKKFSNPNLAREIERLERAEEFLQGNDQFGSPTHK